LGAYVPAAQDQVARVAHADEAREPEGAHAWDERFFYGRQAQDGVLGGDADVAGDGDLQAPAYAVALQAADHGLLQRLQGAEGVLVSVEPPVGDLAAP
jgi:hypothetical protein